VSHGGSESVRTLGGGREEGEVELRRSRTSKRATIADCF